MLTCFSHYQTHIPPPLYLIKVYFSPPQLLPLAQQNRSAHKRIKSSCTPLRAAWSTTRTTCCSARSPSRRRCCAPCKARTASVRPSCLSLSPLFVSRLVHCHSQQARTSSPPERRGRPRPAGASAAHARRAGGGAAPAAPAARDSRQVRPGCALTRLPLADTRCLN